MQGFDVFLVVIGLIIIAISYFISEKVNTKNKVNAGENGIDGQIQDIWTQKDEINIKKRLAILLEEKTEDALIKVDDQLSQISNEKIMAVSEFSDQTLEKINQNHTEVVFLYNMLNEKENEMKTLIHEIDKKKAKLANDAMIEENTTEKRVSLERLDEKQQETSANKLEDVIENRVEPWNEMGRNNNEHILKLYKNGKSIMEIAKILELGQGEVKLVIDLSRGVKS